MSSAENENEWINDDAFSDTDPDFTIIAEGIASTVYRTLASVDDEESQLVVVKSATIHRKFSKEPHDIIKECRILSAVSHINVIPIFDSLRNSVENTLEIWMPYIPHSLSTLLASPRFTPQSNTRFTLASRSLILQTLSAVAYLHEHGVAHRDIKPANILFTPTGRVQVIDFGISWKDGNEAESKEDLWPESKERMYFEVSTGPYRAPELLFGTRSYSAPSIDLWSLGALFAEFFTALHPSSPSYSSHEEHDRITLFDATRGEIGLAWSIFKVLGTPNENTWPGFAELPDAQRVVFTVVPAVALEDFLVNLPDGEEAEAGEKVLDLIKRFLVYPPEQRLRARDAMGHEWFCDKSRPVVLPEAYPVDSLGPSIDDARHETQLCSVFELELESDGSDGKALYTLGNILLELL